MRRILLAFLFSIAPVMAVESGGVTELGWIGVIRIPNGQTNGSFNFNWVNQTNGVVSGNHGFKLTLNSPGYDNTGATNVWTGTFYGTKELRFAYPDHAFARTVMDGTDVLVYTAISDFVCQGDTDVTATIRAGWYDWTTSSNEAATITLTNWSALPYPKVIANWSDVQIFNQITNTSMRVHATAWHAYATQGKPVAAMQFFATDESGDVVTNTETAMRIDRDMPDILPTGEYFTDLDLSGLTHSNLIRSDFRAVPWRGDSSAVFDTRDDAFSFPTFLPSSRTNFYYTGSYGSVAVVSTNGSDSAGIAYPFGTDPTTIPSGEYFLTGSKAGHAVRTNNNAIYGHDTVGSGTVYYRGGAANPFGSTIHSFGSTPKTWITMKPYPGDSVTFSDDVGTDDFSDRVKIEGFTISPATSTKIMFNNIGALWINQCTIDSIGAGPFRNTSQSGAIYWTHNDIVKSVAPIPAVGASEVQYLGLFRGNRLDNLNGPILWFNNIGNLRIPTIANTTFAWNDDASAMSATIPADFQIMYNNYLLGITNNNGANISQLEGTANGKAVIQNVLEFTGSSPAWQVSGTGTLNATNILWINTITEGARNIWFYNPTGLSTGAVKTLNFIKGSVFVVTGEATDIDGSGDTGRTNDWSMRNRVGGVGNIVQMTTNSAFHGNPDFNGLYSFRPANGERTPVDWPKYVDAKGTYRTVATGNGNYRLQSSSPILHDDYANHDWFVPFDIEGNPRGKFDPPGAFNAGNFRRGGFF